MKTLLTTPLKMVSTRCLGRLVRDTPKGVWMLSFEDGGGLFHLPIRCDGDAVVAGGGELCPKCLVRKERTEKRVEEIGSKTTIGGMLPSYLHGKVTDPIPYWSRLYDGAWYRLKLAGGCRISEETMARAKKAAADATEELQAVAEPEAIPSGAGKRGRKAGGASTIPAETVTTPPEEVVQPAEKPKRKAKTLAEKRAEMKELTTALADPVAPPQPQRTLLSFINAPSVPAEETLESIVSPIVAEAAGTPVAHPKAVAKPVAKPIAKRPAKKAGGATAKVVATEPEILPPKAKVDCGTRADPVDDVQTIRVVSKNLGGRQLYYEPKKEKVYDMKFKYLGRWDAKKECIVEFPDSDREP